MNAVVSDRSVTLDGGPSRRPLSVRISEAGVGGRPLFVVHGFTGARTDFEHAVVPFAERGWHVVAPDQRGHGESSQPGATEDYSLSIFAADLIQLADALGWDRFTLLGHSMGGMVAQEVALAAPERVAALVLMGTTPEPVEAEDGLPELAAKTALEQGIDVVADLTADMASPLDNPAYERAVAADPTYGERGDRNLRASSPAMYAAMVIELTRRSSRLADLAAIAAPTLVIVGAHDPLLDPSRRMAAVIPGARLVVCPDGGHSPQFEDPTAWLAAVTAFLDEVADHVAAP